MESGDYFPGNSVAHGDLRVVEKIRDLPVVQVQVMVLDFSH